MSDLTITHKDLATKLGVSETTIKSYRRKFPGCFPVASKGKPIRFKPEAGDVALRIRDLFSTGMSVEEVRDRLIEDFSWWRPRESGGQKRDTSRIKSELPQNFATAVSNMAKSMISLNQQQSSILAAMQRIEEMLRELGLSGFDAEVAADGKSSREAVFKEVKSEVAAINVRLHSLTQSLAEQNAAFVEERATFTGALEKIVQLLHGKSGIIAAPTAKTEPSVPDKPAEQSAVQPAVAASAAAPSGPEFPRHILALPLVVRTDDGSYISAGGKSIGRISLNDIKAILGQAYLPPENFSLGTDYRDDGWWVTLKQRGIPAPMESSSIAIQVAEITSSKGVTVLEARKYEYNGKPYPSTELVRFVTGVGKD